MFGLFKPAWQSTNTLKRLRAVNQLREQKATEREILIQLVQDDPDEQVRTAALERLSQAKSFAALIALSHQSSQRIALIRRWLANTIISQWPALLAEQLSDQAEHRSDWIRALDSDDCLRIIETFDEPTLLEIALVHRDPRLRKAAAEHIDNHALLTRLQRESRDKSLLQISRRKLHEVRQAQTLADTRQAACDRALAHLQTLASSPDLRQYSARSALVKQEWEQCQAHANEAQKNHAKTALEAIDARQSTLDQSSLPDTAADATPPIDKTPTTDPIDAHAQALFAQTWEDAELLDAEIERLSLSDADAHQLRTRVSPLSEALKLLAQACHTPAKTADAERLTQLNHMLTPISWPASSPVPERLATLEQELRTLRAQHKAEQDAQKLVQKRALDKAEQQLGQLYRQLKSRRLGAANQAYNQLQKLLQAHTFSLGASFNRRLEKAQAQLQQLRDWQAFSSTPRKTELCEQMEALIDADLPPEGRIDQVRALRTAWRSCSAGDDRQNQDPLRARFETAAKAAYAPAGDYAEGQKALRERNLAVRETLCTTLEQWLEKVDWDSFDLAQLQTIISTARNDWHAAQPIHFAAARPLQVRFDNALKTLQQHNNQYRRENRDLREALLLEAEKLLADEQSDAPASARALQQRWSGVGPTFSADYQRQKRRFSQVIDQIFQRQRNLRTQQKQEIDTKRQQAEQILDQIDALSAEPSAEQYAQLCTAYEDLITDELPGRLRGGLDKRYSACCQKYEQELQAAPRRALWRQMLAIFTLLRENDQNADDQLPEQALAPNAALAAQVRARSHSAPSEDTAALFAQLAVRAEILAEIDSPEDARTLRRKIQLAQLQDGSNKYSAQTAQKQLLTIFSTWIDSPRLTSQSAMEDLDRRLQQALSQVFDPH